MSMWLRTATLALVLVLALAVVAHATTWVFWIGAPNANSPSNGTTTTWGLWTVTPVIPFLYSTQNARFEVENYLYISAPAYDIHPLGSSGYETWIALSSAYTLNNYVYQGTVGAYSNVAIGNNYTFSSGYQYFIAVAWEHPSSEICGQLYFHADVYNNSTGTATFYVTYIISNRTWTYVTFYSGSAPSNSWFNPVIQGPNTCLDGISYLYIAAIAVNTTEYTVGTAQVSFNTVSEGASYTPGTQYSWSKSPASGDTIDVPWTSYANPYFITIIQQVVNTAGSSTDGSFYFTAYAPIVWKAGAWNTFYSSVPFLSNSYYFIFAYDNDTGYFPQSSVVATGCPSGVYMLPATVSSSVTKILSCNGISSPSNGIAIYPTDYAKYSSNPVSYNPPTGYVVTFSYTDSAGNTYSLPDYFATPTTVYLYVASGSWLRRDRLWLV